MISFLIWLAGCLLCAKAILEIFNKPITMVGKAICTVVMLCTSWVGLAVYYFYAKDKLVDWFK